MAPEFDLSGNVAVVTGAAGRLGPAFAAALAGAGATVIGIDLRAAEDGELPVLEADVTDRPSLEDARDRIAADWGPPSILVNAAGIDQPPSSDGRSYTLEEIPLDDFRRTVDVNLAGTFSSMQVFTPAMTSSGRGSVINVSSVYATLSPDPTVYSHLDSDPPFIKPPAYGASKAAVVNLSRYFARLLGPAGVRVNALAPGGVRDRQDDEFVAKYSARVPLGRMASLDDLGGALVFLASDAAAYVTGQELRVDGGITA